MNRNQATPSAAPATPRPSGGEGFRPDLEGLRGIAILTVVAFHAGIAGFGGGFVGVDVFYVLSGFLITGLLLREIERSGRVDFVAFYARRARRILPAAAAILVLTLAAAAIVMSPLDLPHVADDALSVALSAGNIRFALDATDYFASDHAPSPFLHYWSLGVEEQFYLVWPLLLLVAARLLGRRRGPMIALLVVVASSTVLAVWLTSGHAAWAFFSLPTRAWQLALGGLIAAAAATADRTRMRAGWWLGWLGLAVIVGATVLVDPVTTPYPGFAALAPTLGTAAVIVARPQVGLLGRLLTNGPLRFLGRISFSLYLIHWPLFVLPAINLPIGEELPLVVRALLLVFAVVAAWASYRWIEEPFHRGRWIAPAPRTVVRGGVTIALTAVLAFGLGQYETFALQGSVQPGQAYPSLPVLPTPSVWPPPTLAPTPTGSVEPTTPPPSNGPPTPTPVPTPEPVQAVPADLQPPLALARDDWEQIEIDNCELNNLEVKLRNCVYGDVNSPVTVALVGDSHAAQWFPALQVIANQEHWRLVALTKYSCRFMDLPMYSLVLKREYTECYTWRQLVVDELNRIKPDLVVTSIARDARPMREGDGDPAVQGAATARLLGEVPGAHVIIADTPIFLRDVPACLARNLGDVSPCETSREVAFGATPLVLEETAVADGGGTLADLSDTICWRDPCPVITGNVLMWRDAQHLTATYAALLAGTLFNLLPPLGSVGSP